MKLFKYISTILIVVIFSTIAYGQKQPKALMTIAGEKITADEFMQMYSKNTTAQEKKDAQNVKDYVDLFINFKLKVHQAKEMGLDTLDSFKKELKGYRSQLATPYLTDEETETKLINEAHERMNYNIRASHILILVDKNALPADTLVAYNKIMDIRSKALKGENFAKLAVEYSEDPSAKPQNINGVEIGGNAGDLGYFTVFNMIYPFENIAYTMKENDISMPIRSAFGYHIVKLTDKIPALGEIQLAHVIILKEKDGVVQDTTEIRNKAINAYKQLAGGANFGNVASQFSDDKTTRNNGGVLPWFQVNKLMPVFITNILQLKKNEISKPFESPVAWHIIKLIDNKVPGKFEEEKDAIAKKIVNSDRYAEVEKAFVEKSKTKYKFTENPKALQEVTNRVTDSIFSAKWKLDEAKGLNSVLFKIGDCEINQQDFARYLYENQRVAQPQEISTYVKNHYSNFVNSEVKNFVDDRLEMENPEFSRLLEEYHDGILLFDITDKMVWSKALEDTVGLAHFYESVKSNYLWPQRLDATIFSTKSIEQSDNVVKDIKNGLTDKQIIEKYAVDSIPTVTIEKGLYTEGESETIDSIEWKKGVFKSALVKSKEVKVVKVNGIIDPMPKELADVKGVIVSEYQEQLEKQWINNLRNTYPFSIDEKYLKKVLKKL